MRPSKFILSDAEGSVSQAMVSVKSLMLILRLRSGHVSNALPRLALSPVEGKAFAGELRGGADIEYSRNVESKNEKSRRDDKIIEKR